MISAAHPIDAAAVAAHYDELDPFYLRLWGEHLHHGLWTTGHESVEEAVVHLVHHVAERGKLSGLKVCDVGCGYGATARLLATRYACRVTGFTLSTRQFARATARSRGPGDPVFVQQDWLRNDMPCASFDAVLAIESLSHMAEKDRFFAQAVRLLRPGGRMILCAWLSSEHPAPWTVRHLLQPICDEGRLPGLGSESDYRTAVARCGLELEFFEDLTCRVRKTWVICIRRALRAALMHADMRRFLLNPRSRNRAFLLSLPRLALAYRLGAMRYGLFVATRRGITP